MVFSTAFIMILEPFKAFSMPFSIVEDELEVSLTTSSLSAA